MKSLKLMVGMLFAVLMIGQAVAGVPYRRDGDGRDSHPVDAMREGNSLIQHNKHILPFVPADIKSVKASKGNRDSRKTAERGFYDCDMNGEIAPRDILATCFTYRSKSTDTSWVLRSSVSAGGIGEVFKVEKGQPELWVKFDPKKRNINTYASAEAQKFAATKGGGNTEIAKNQNSKDAETKIVQEASKSDPKELLKQGLGTILKGF